MIDYNIRVHDEYVRDVGVSRTVTPPSRNIEFSRNSMLLFGTVRSPQQNDNDDAISDSCTNDRSLLTLATELRNHMQFEGDIFPSTSFERSDQNQEETNNIENPTSTIEIKKSKRKKNRSDRKAKDAKKTAAIFYSECYVRGIGSEIANEAARDSHEKYNKWWEQEINHSGIPGSLGDSFLVPKFRRTLHPKQLPDKSEILGQGDPSTCDSFLENDLTLEKEGDKIESNEYEIPRIKPSKYLSVTHDDYSLPHLIKSSGNNEFSTMTRSSGYQYSSGYRESSHRYDSAKPCKMMKLAEETIDTAKPQRNFNLFPELNDTEKQFISPVGRLCRPTISRPIPLRVGISAMKQLKSTPISENYVCKMSDQQESNGYENQLPEILKKTSDLTMISTSPESKSTKRKRMNNALQNNTKNCNISVQDHKYPDLHKNTDSNHCQIHSNEKSTTKNSTKDVNRNVNIPPIFKNSLPCRNQDVSQKLKTELLHYLACSGGDITDKRFLGVLDQLHAQYQISGRDVCSSRQGDCFGKEKKRIDGMWLTLSRPNFDHCVGRNSDGDYMYTLGRMSFDMFRPVNLVCSINAMFNLIKPETVKDVANFPKSLRNKITCDKALFSYEIITAFTIQPDSFHFGKNSANSKVEGPVEGIMTVNAHVLPDPEVPNRLSVWFTGGDMKPNNSKSNQMKWKQIFGSVLPKRRLQEHARILAAKLLLGAHIPDEMEDDGTMRYELRRPIGGHGVAYLDVLYLDETLRIVQGHRGTIYVHLRVPYVSN